LRRIRDSFPLRPLGCVDAPAQFGKFRFWEIHLLKWANKICLLAASLCTSGLGHGVLLSAVSGSWGYAKSPTQNESSER
jgi:hypothetical protein